MKRITWLLLLALGAVMAQVQPVDVHVLSVKKCCCCDQAGDCGMRDCGLPPIAGQRVVPVAETPSVIRATTERAVPSPRTIDDRLSTRNLVRVSLPALRVADPASPANVPLFKEHCSYLI